MSVNVAINGVGRIGRMVLRKMMDETAVKVVAVNAKYSAETLAHLIKYDTIHGPSAADIRVAEHGLVIDGQYIHIVNERHPEHLPWRDLAIDIVIEATGVFKERKDAARHIQAGAGKVIITAPGKNEDATIVMGVNDGDYNARDHHIISNASCTTNGLAPLLKVLDAELGMTSGMMTTIHSYTNDQNVTDNPHKDLRRARACHESIIPTSTGAAEAVYKVLPQMAGRLSGTAIRVPTPNVSLLDLVIDVSRDVTSAYVNHILARAADSHLKTVLGYTEEPLVSKDFNGDEHSAVVDGLSTQVMGHRKIKVLAWYDNEWGYACRVVDLAQKVAQHLPKKSAVQVS